MSAPALEWRNRHDGTWEATIGVGPLSMWLCVDRFGSYEVRDCDATKLLASDHDRGRGREAAQSAALTAATRMLVEALASVPVHDPEGVADSVYIADSADSESWCDVQEFAELDPDDAEALGHALLCAASKARAGQGGGE